MSEEVNKKGIDNQSEINNVQEIFFKYLPYWKWFIVSLIVCLAVAFIYLKYTIPVYNVSAAVIIKDDKKGGNGTSELSVFEGMGLLGGSNNIDNEVEVLKSKSTIKSVVNALGLHTSYKLKGSISSTELYTNSPLEVKMDPQALDSLSGSILLNATMNPDRSLKIEGLVNNEEVNTTLHNLPALLRTSVGDLTVSYRPNVPSIVNKIIEVSINRPSRVAKAYLGRLSIAPTSKTTSVVNLSLSETNCKRGVDFLTKLVEVYNQDAMADKNKVALNTKLFIDDRIAIIDKELGSAEKTVEDYKRGQKMTDLQSDAQLVLQTSSEYEKKLVEAETQLNLVDYLQKHVSNKANRYSLVPSNVGLEDPTLVATINEYNKTLLERDRLLRTASENNPTVLNLNGRIDALRGNVTAAIASVHHGLVIAKNDINHQTRLFNSQIENAPTQERVFTELSRQQQIKASLFEMLLQKREENNLSLAASANSAKIIDEPLASDAPVSPKSSMIYLVALIIGLVIPIGIIYIRDLFQYKIRTRADVDKVNKLPFLAEIPNYEGESNIAVRENDNASIAEAFRVLRTNLLFILGADKKVILFTSTQGGEGKSFVSLNAAISLALLNKKVVVVGLDIRKPRMAEYLNLNAKNGITSYLSGFEDNLDNLIVPSGIHPNLYALPAGPLPPNPSEQLVKESLDKAFEYLRNEYDYIIVDSAPIGLVTDTLIINRVVDATAYVCRVNYSNKVNLKVANEIMEQKKLTNMSLVVNGIDNARRGYGYVYGYGQGYGYGYGYGYGDDNEKKQKKSRKKRKFDDEASNL
ncbi:polysaccharide biosynthesis tyrosine autokinase [uncultured Bacteroides sp.]|uniref:GumC family protein n=1 Tax=uncultured Bacteroides sp. TaxID=162156 RepID=UPI002AA67C36|nr:polysaccharide biosynthesis tyrosine autokinase [uncultured Bacteroides sp.]